MEPEATVCRMKCLVLLLAYGVVAWAQTCGPKPGAVNLARLGEASQVSTYTDSPTPAASLAIDGDKETNYFKHHCAHTNNDFAPWWRLNLKKSYQVDSVAITNRMESCTDRLKGAQVRVGNSEDNNNPVCGTITDVSQATITLCCKGMEGQYVSVVIPDRKEWLTLCEVEVYGQETKTEPRVCW
ncbi:pentraxin fusion protein-like [Rhinophrynus dorsalis]